MISQLPIAPQLDRALGVAVWGDEHAGWEAALAALESDAYQLDALRVKTSPKHSPSDVTPDPDALEHVPVIVPDAENVEDREAHAPIENPT